MYPTPHHYAVLPLWAAHTYVYEEFDTTPRLFLDSAVPGAGKTRTLELLEETARKPLLAFATSPAALIRTIDKGGRTILMDEIDTIYNKNSGSEDVTAVVNAGYKSGSRVPRCVGNGMDIDVVELNAYAPMALAGLHSNVPEAVRSRSIHFRMKKRRPSEIVSAYYRRDVKGEAVPIKEGLEAWLEPNRDRIRAARPRMPKGVEDRPAEVWEPLLVIADLAGGAWPLRAREACIHFVFAKSGYARPIGLDLLVDVRAVFDGAEKMTSAALVAALVAIPDARWNDIRGSFLTQAALANHLRPFDVRPKTIRMPSGGTAKGYVVAGDGGLGEAWERNLRPDDVQDQDDLQRESTHISVQPVTGVTGVTSQIKAYEGVTDSVTSSKIMTDPVTLTGIQKVPSTSSVTPVTAVTPFLGAIRVSPSKAWLLAQESTG
ncbi:DUF3631 domain-containing protein [Rhodococcus erythropolis]|nr:DUF3631 domain-containing protein [Rhodococcus erythropolis]